MEYKVETSEYNDTLCSYQNRKINAEKIYFTESGTLIFYNKEERVIAAFNKNEWKSLEKIPD
jgi:hypothetical protein